MYLPQKARDATSQPLYETIIQPLIQSIIQKMILELPNVYSIIGFMVSIDWIKNFIKDHLY